MITPNLHYGDLKDSYLFYHISQKVQAYLEGHPEAVLYRMGIGDVPCPFAPPLLTPSTRGWRIRAVKALFMAICRSAARHFSARPFPSIMAAGE